MGYVIRAVCLAIIEKFQDELISFPDNNESWRVTIGEFASMFGMPNVVGAIDGSHIPINSPCPEMQRAFYNRKMFHSVILQGTVNAKGMFMDVNVGWPGSAGDPRVYASSELCQRVNATPSLIPDGTYLLGDKIYTNAMNFLAPHKIYGTLTAPQKKFNKIHSQTRVVVETAFGMLKGRWRRLSTPFALRLNILPDVVMAACILHNICVLKHNPLKKDRISAYVRRERAFGIEDFRLALRAEYPAIEVTLLAQGNLNGMTDIQKSARGEIIDFNQNNPTDLRLKVGDWLVRHFPRSG